MFLRNFPLATWAGKSKVQARTTVRSFLVWSILFDHHRVIASAALWAAVSFFLLLPASGCQRNQIQRDMLESQMRQQERAMRDMNDELGRSRAISTSLTMENQSLRGGPVVPISEPAKAPLKAIEFGRGTGGVDEDRVNGDEILQVVIEPKDIDGHTVKAPGTLHLQVYEIQPEGMKTPLSSWDVGPEQLRKAYKAGLLQSGYVLILPWKTAPSREKLRVSALLRIESGQAFEVEKDFKVNIPTGTIATRSNPIQVLPAIPSGMPGILPPPSTGTFPSTLPKPFGGSAPSGPSIPGAPQSTDSHNTNQAKIEPIGPKPIATSGPLSNQPASPSASDAAGMQNKSAPQIDTKGPAKTVPTIPTKVLPDDKGAPGLLPPPRTGAPQGESKHGTSPNPGAVLLDPVVK